VQTISDGGHLASSTYDEDQEDEAAWLGATLLLPRPALLWIRNRGLTDDAAIEHFQASRQMFQWRLRMTGVDYQLGLKTRYRAIG
jgi:hypothetical protein